jgi:hypothetical protein
VAALLLPKSAQSSPTPSLSPAATLVVPQHSAGR